MNIGIFACDPGGATGLAWGIFNPNVGISDSLLGKMEAGSTTITGSPGEQIKEVAALWQSFYSACVRSALLPPDRVWPVFENFIIRPGETGGGLEMSISTSIIWGFEGYRMGSANQFRKLRPKSPIYVPQLVLQMAGQASGFANNQRLKDWGLWVRGREHERSAWRHVALFLRTYMNSHPT